MLEIIITLLFILAISSLVLPWLHRSKIDNLETKIRWLEQKIHRLGSDTDENHDQILDTKDERTQDIT